VRTELPLHDMPGGSTGLPNLLPTLFPGEVDPAAMQAGVTRARYILQNAATLGVLQVGRDLRVSVTNETGHKLPTGYPEGRRMWINVQYYDAGNVLIAESGAYDPATGVLSHDPGVKIYEIEPATSGIPGLPDGSLFHFVLNSIVLKDNRIPPRGFTNAAFAAFGGSPVAAVYADGQFWDYSYYGIPSTATSVVVTLYYQSTSKEYVEFLRDENFTNTKGQEMYALWANNGKCPPEMMAQAQLALAPPLAGDFNGDGYVDTDDFALWADCFLGPDVEYATGCEPGDADYDIDVDLLDFADVQLAFTGPGTMAPAAPTGLLAVGQLHAVSLDWNDNVEPDLAGYNVYRADTAGGPYALLNGTLLTASSYQDTAVVDGTPYYYVVTAEDTWGNESAASNEASAAPQGANKLHVAALVLSLNDLGGGNKYGVATVTIQDNLGAPVSNATVTGTFAGDYVGSRSGVTNTSGVAVLTIGPKGGRTVFTFCVDGVTHATLAYDASQNVQTCGAFP